MMNHWKKRYQSALLLIMSSYLLFCLPAQGAENMMFSGALVNAPCILRPGDEAVALEFRTIIDKYLYSDSRTPSQPFLIHLDECDAAVARGVKVTFIGTEDPTLPGLLALDGSSTARGVGIGIETSAGQFLPINTPGPNIPLTSGNMVLAYQAYAQVQPSAKVNHGVILGAFTATATFALEYQ